MTGAPQRDVAALASAQHRFLGILLDPRPDDHVFQDAAIATLLRTSGDRSPRASMEVYRGMLRARFREALAASRPALASVLGTRFELLVRDYMTAHPSRTWTLDRIGDALPGFLRRWRGVPRIHGTALADLARLEAARERVLTCDPPEAPDITPLRSLPLETLASAVLVPADALALVALRHDAVAAREPLERGDPALLPRPRRCLVVVVRGPHGPVQWDEDPDTFRVLARLVQGSPLGRALAAAGGASAASISRALERWMSRGVFRRIAIQHHAAEHPRPSTHCPDRSSSGPGDPS